MADEMLMSWDHIRNLSRAGMDVQSHSHAHRVLHTLTADEAVRDKESLGTRRFRVEGVLGEASICHCRMCQRATGGVFAALAGTAPDNFAWTRGTRVLPPTSTTR